MLCTGLHCDLCALTYFCDTLPFLALLCSSRRRSYLLLATHRSHCSTAVATRRFAARHGANGGNVMGRSTCSRLSTPTAPTATIFHASASSDVNCSNAIAATSQRTLRHYCYRACGGKTTLFDASALTGRITVATTAGNHHLYPPPSFSLPGSLSAASCIRVVLKQIAVRVAARQSCLSWSPLMNIAIKL